MGVPDRREGEIWVKPQPKHAVANFSQTISPMLPPGEYKRGVEWNCRSDSAICQITLVLVYPATRQLLLIGTKTMQSVIIVLNFVL